MKIAVLGAGAWGTALAISFASRHDILLWARDPGQVAMMSEQRTNARYLQGHPFPPTLNTSAAPTDLAGADLAVVATPLAGLRDAAALLAQHCPEAPLLWACKGMEVGSSLLPHQIVAEVRGTIPCGALTGPSFAQEVARGLPTAIVLASSDGAFASHTARELSTPRLRIYANEDVIGAEIGGAVKNVLAIASGICDGLGLGLNARAALVTRGLAEITRFGCALGAQRETFMGLTGLGDLLLTCTGDLSRNRRVGLGLAAGHSLPTITGHLGHVAEGVSAAHAVLARAATLGVDMPITASVCAVLDARLSAADAAAQLMERDPGSE
ncbi:MAG: NAD(P)-dependent glycerol-3-phosphate dehydrogenase [Proteobacteria bacterium]|nr:NAD(P)-dependent glycerol-3-phosphate dehydrogenase [Pseudomonadota bacterium]HQR04213.1 NAD(P)H-dependent glycerol-3-phosphate dehydrogenase [Rhodocyclaceae bacterium]